MISLAADENFRGAIFEGLLARNPGLDLVYVQQVGLAGAPDEEILAWAAENGRVVLTHDRRTMVGLAYERVAAGLRMPGVCVVRTDIGIGPAIEDIELLLGTHSEDDWRNRILFVSV